ncbi:MAG: hypothetical protein H6825_10355 [Planctomycetes bacterium]|nr:hypothetical protein [Planctomycetota bacterium]
MLREGRCQCPCCDYYALDARGRHDVCPVCFWEDDGVDLGDLDEVSSANHISLRRARANFERFGAADQAALSLVAPKAALRGLRREVRAPD